GTYPDVDTFRAYNDDPALTGLTSKAREYLSAVTLALFKAGLTDVADISKGPKGFDTRQIPPSPSAALGAPREYWSYIDLGAYPGKNGQRIGAVVRSIEAPDEEDPAFISLTKPNTGSNGTGVPTLGCPKPRKTLKPISVMVRPVGQGTMLSQSPDQLFNNLMEQRQLQYGGSFAQGVYEAISLVPLLGT